MNTQKLREHKFKVIPNGTRMLGFNIVTMKEIILARQRNIFEIVLELYEKEIDIAHEHIVRLYGIDKHRAEGYRAFICCNH